MVVANLFGVLEGPELLILLAVILLLFGGKKLPELARSLGQAKREFHGSVSEPTAAAGDEPAPTPGIEPPSTPSPAGDNVTISRAELDRLRAAAQRDDHTAN